MLDTFHLGTNGTKYQIFTSTGGLTSDWRIWNKPRGVEMIQMCLVGAGAGGGGGFTAAAGNIRGGGGSGGAGGICRVIFQADLLPDVLYILAPRGGVGGAAGATGGAGIRSFVSTRADFSNAGFLVAISGAASAGGGVGGSASAGTAGAGGTIYTTALASFIHCGLWVAIAGAAGQAAGAVTGANGVAAPALGATVVGGGGGGGSTPAANTNFTGGAITGAGIITTIPGGLAAGGNGDKGFDSFPLYGTGGGIRKNPFCSTGGSGGGTNGAAGTGGRGGDGGIGSGGGGGNGGSGMVMITCW